MKSSYRLLIEGWRYIPHSYAIVNQFQCLELLKIPWLRVVHRDMPYFRNNWQAVTGLFTPEAEAAIGSIPAVSGDVEADAVMRITFPYNCAPSKFKRTCVFGTAEFRFVPKEYIAQKKSLADVMAESDILIVTPSQWSRDGFIAGGANPDRVVVIPHGVEPAIYHPIGEPDRTVIRTELGCNGFTFLTLGAMTMNKGMAQLLKAFASVSQKHPRVQLIMKGLEALYPSRDFLLHQMKELSEAELHRIQDRIHYIDQTLHFHDMARLYQAADAYVSPYRAEGFNMPCLEAAACGTIVICTQGGATDDFIRPEFALPIESIANTEKISPDAFGTTLQPSYDHLLHQMMTAVERPDLCAQARVAGPAFVTEHFTWRHAVEKLIRVLFPEQGADG
jgi:glycosyltransferase involved in cell wall biosynthesis